MNIINLKEFNLKDLELLLSVRQTDAFYSSCEFPETKEDFQHNINLQKAIQEVEDEIKKRNMVATFGKRDIVQ